MFIHNFKYSLKTLFKDKMLIFWTFMFPIILGTLFSMAFSNIEDSEKLSVIDIAIVENKKNEIVKNVFDSLDDLFNVSYVNMEEAKNLISEDNITGYLVLDDKLKVVVNQNGVYETIFKYVVDQILEYQKIVSSVASLELKDNMDAGANMDLFISNIYKEVMEKMNSEVNVKDISSKNLSYTMIEFYTLIALTALYGGIFAVVSLNKCLANMSTKGSRIEVSPTKKSVIVLSSLVASYIAQLVGILLLFLYTIFILDIDYGNDLLMIVVTAVLGSLAGLSLGVFVASMFKTSENTKTGILIAVTMFCCFLSGMMGITMKYVVDYYTPIINKINPAAMITDAFYSLYYVGMDRFYFDIFSLFVFSVILISVSILKLRRQKYDSI